MSGTTSVPFPVFGPTGFALPAEQDILTGVLADMNAAFGGAMNLSLSTPQGQWASSLAAIIGDCNDQFLSVVNQFDPAAAIGRWQDAIGRIYFIERMPAEATTVQALCTGLVGVSISTGSLAQASDGNLYSCTSGGVIGGGGNVSLPFACAQTGAIPCPAASLTSIYQAVPGWDTISNPADGIVGQAVETPLAFELRRAASVALNSVGALPAIRGAVLNVPGVLDAFVTDNVTGSPVTLDGVSVPAHGLYVCVAGGDPQAVATAIWSKKMPGCAYAGATTRTVTDTNAGFIVPLPTYSVSFQTAASQAIIALVKIANTTLVPSSALAQIQAVMLAAAVGGDGGAPLRIGSMVFASRFYASIALLGSWAQIVSIKLGSVAAPAATITASIATTVLTVTAVGSGTLAVGQTIIGASVPDGTQIIALGSGAGGTGTYTLSSLLPTIASEAMTAVLPTLDDIQLGVAHAPALTAANISLTLV